MKRLLYILFFINCSLLTFNLLSQQPTQEWVQRFSWNNFASGLSVKLDSSGNVYVLMKLYSDTTLGDFGLNKYSPGGILIWSAHYNSPSNLSDIPNAFDVTNTGDVYITGYTTVNAVQHITTVKFNSSGFLQWAKVYNGGGPGDGASAILTDKNGNVIVVGGTAINNNIAYGLTIKYNPAGDTLWVRKFTQLPNYNHLSSLVIDDSNAIYATGYYEVTNPLAQYLTLKYDSNGSLKWYNLYNYTPYSNIGDWIGIDSNRNVYVIGTNYSPPNLSYNTLLKLNNAGATQWARPFTGLLNYSGCEAPGGLVITSDGNSILYTTVCANSQGNGEIVTLKYDSSGDSLWVRPYSQGATGGVPTIGPALKLDKYNNIYIAGYAVFPSTSSDYITIKYLPNGTQQWVMAYNGTITNSNDGASDLVIDTSLNVYVTGSSTRQINPYLLDVVTVKYSQPNGIQQITANLPEKFRLEQNYPNPFNPNTKFKFGIPKPEEVKIIINDVLGREITMLVNEKLLAGNYEVTWDAGNLSSGIYFYTIFTKDFIETKKAILIK